MSVIDRIVYVIRCNDGVEFAIVWNNDDIKGVEQRTAEKTEELAKAEWERNGKCDRSGRPESFEAYRRRVYWRSISVLAEDFPQVPS